MTHHDFSALCPCDSGKTYGECCQVFHRGATPDTALHLMRARYAAYAMDYVDYIIETTHSASPYYSPDRSAWESDLHQFSQKTEFRGLEILDAREEGVFAVVTFVAHIVQEGQDRTFTEQSLFEKHRGAWTYRSGKHGERSVSNMTAINLKRLLPLTYYGDGFLRNGAKPVTKITDEVHSLVEKMVETIDCCDGIGLAAPQVHHSLRLFVIHTPIEDEKGRLKDIGDVQIFINPHLSNPSEEMSEGQEGCLSMPTIRSPVRRPKSITVEYTDLEGNTHKKRVSGWEARVIMHENDHLDGVLFVDRLLEEERESLAPLLTDLEHRIY